MNFFWLHITKSGGTSIKDYLTPYYTRVDGLNRPPNFIQSTPDCYNDIVNNYRVVMGDYQFKRALFAKKFLFKREWDELMSFAFSRNPVDRCLSMFYYLYWPKRGFRGYFYNVLQKKWSTGKFQLCDSRAFDVFLEKVKEARGSKSIYTPFNSHFTTHTATMWDDVTDLEGEIVLKKIYRLENLVDGLNEVFEFCGLPKRIKENRIVRNRSKRSAQFVPTRMQMRQIEEIYGKDFDLYETAH
jgi:hypothetical protein